MNGNIFYAIGLTVFMFIFMYHAYQFLRKEFKEQKSDRIEIMGCACVLSFVIVFFGAGLATCFLEFAFYNNQAAFWFILFAICDTLLRIVCKFSNFLLRRIFTYEELE